MTTRYQEKLTKALTVCAIALCVSLGLCGLNYLSFSWFGRSSGSGSVLMGAAFVETAAIILSFLGLIVVGILMLFAAIFRGRGESE
jgi:hypothetical protein